MDRLMNAGYRFSDLAGKTDYELRCMKRRFGDAPQEPSRSIKYQKKYIKLV